LHPVHAAAAMAMSATMRPAVACVECETRVRCMAGKPPSPGSSIPRQGPQREQASEASIESQTEREMPPTVHGVHEMPSPHSVLDRQS